MLDAHTASPMTAVDRAEQAKKATWISVVVNLLLTVAQLLVGWLAHSQSLIAHGLHSFSDLLSDFLVLWASREGAAPADRAHPYGHGRVETAATLVLGFSLLLIGAGILWDSGLRLQRAAVLPDIEMLAFWIAVLTVVAKEGLYRYLLAVARKLRSQLLTANALHTRADAASALVVVVGIGGALVGWTFLDLLAAALMGFMILRMGGQLAWGALKELIDTGLDEAQLATIEAALLATPGVLDVHNLRSRRMAQHVLVDTHVRVDPRISVSEAHRIGESARDRVLQSHPDVLDVLVHVDPADDVEPDAATQLPGREALLPMLAPLLGDLPVPARVVLHYLGGRIEAELYFDHSLFAGSAAMREAEALLAARLADWPMIGCIRLHLCDAP